MHAAMDCDSFVYAAGFASQHTNYLIITEDGFVVDEVDNKKAADEIVAEDESLSIEPNVIASSAREAEMIVDSMLTACINAMDVDTAHIYLTGGNQWRPKYATIYKYKGNRDNMVRPVHYEHLRNYLIRQWEAFVVEYIEADDAVIMESYKHEDSTIICSIDKDLRQKHGLHFNPKDSDRGVFEVSEWAGMVNFYTQLITGDSTDNIKGLSERLPRRGLGQKRAAAILDGARTERELFERVSAAYGERYGDGETYISWDGKEISASRMDLIDENAQLLYLARYDGDKWRVPK